MEEQEERLEGELGLSMDGEDSSAIYPDAEVRVEKAQYSILNLKRLCESHREFIISPELQTGASWKDKNASELVESILMGIPLPAIYLFEARDGRKQVVDGRQRITAILDFLSGQFRLQGLRILSGLNGKTFNELESKLQGIFEEYQLFFYIIQPPTPERIKYDIYHRVNRGGTLLNNQEIRYALYCGKATKLIDDICESEEFKKATGYRIGSGRMLDRYVVLRAVAFYYLFSGDLRTAESGKAIEYKNDLDDFLAKVMIYMNQQKEFEELERLKSSFLAGLRNINRIMGEDAFRFESAGECCPVSIPLFECLIYLFLLEWEIKNEEAVRAGIQKLKSEFDRSGCFCGNTETTVHVNDRYSAMDNLLMQLNR